jgi:hypothetical protein
MTDSYNLLSPAYHRSCSSAWQHHCHRQWRIMANRTGKPTVIAFPQRQVRALDGSGLSRVVDADIAVCSPVARVATTPRREPLSHTYGREFLEPKWG